MGTDQLMFEQYFQDKQLFKSPVQEADPQLGHAIPAARTCMKSWHFASVDPPPPAFSCHTQQWIFPIWCLIYRSKAVLAGKTERQDREENDLSPEHQTKQYFSSMIFLDFSQLPDRNVFAMCNVKHSESLICIQNIFLMQRLISSLARSTIKMPCKWQMACYRPFILLFYNLRPTKASICQQG